ncbi:unnamed protein product [Cuscuta campestris]|uniref:Uncharacterized protein n=1 Tax=Cuscuta campestris TaxID=132261 RepID=A0A484KRF8_9ASTE|nr:unnamed protein product [Cuscuta campestris]
MKIDGQTMQFNTPVNAGEVVKEYSGLILLDSESVKEQGIRAKPLRPDQQLQPERLYFLVEPPPQLPAAERFPRRVRSGIQMSAKDRLESLMLARTRSASDMTSAKSSAAARQQTEDGGVRLKLRIPKAELEKLVTQGDRDSEAVEKIMRFCVEQNGRVVGSDDSGLLRNPASHSGLLMKGPKSGEKRVGFGEIQHVA